MKYFVTGGAGFIGSTVVDALMERGGSVTVYDNLSGGKMEFINHHAGKPNFKFVKGDLLDESRLAEAIAGHDFVWHLAANPDVRQGASSPGVDLKNGTIITYNLLEAMRAANINKIAFSSSSVVYGEPSQMPTPEEYGPLIPISMYGASKLACEGLMTAYSHTFGFKVWIFRFANVIGKRGTHGILVDFVRKLKRDPLHLEILGDGTQKKSYLMVEECVDAMMYGVAKAGDPVNIFNIGSEDQIFVKRIAEVLIEEMKLKNVSFDYTGGKRGWKGDIPIMLLGTKKINKLGWKNKLTSEDAIRRSARLVIAQEWSEMLK